MGKVGIGGCDGYWRVKWELAGKIEFSGNWLMKRRIGGLGGNR